MKISSVKNVYGCLLAILTLTVCVRAQEAQTWTLKAIKGNNAKQWDAGSWRWKDGNPVTDHGATWTAVYQGQTNPLPTSEYTPMVKGTYVGYYRIWQGDNKTSKDPYMQYRENRLIVRPATKMAHRSESVGIMFVPTEAGEYEVNVKAKLHHVKNPTAGYVQVGLFQMIQGGRAAETIFDTRMNINKPKVFGKGKYLDVFEVVKKITFEAEQELVLRLQAVNPGNASVGTCILKIEKFAVTKVK